MKNAKPLSALAVLALGVGTASHAYAAGTPAGTVINNTATATFSIGSTPNQALPVNAPSQVTPRNIAPPASTAPRQILRPPEAAPPLPPIDPSLAVESGDVQLDGGFAQMADANAAFIAGAAHRHVLLQQLYSAARGLEQAYARRGYILARVILPPQKLAPGATVKVVVVDGFIEGLDLSHLAAPVRGAVGARLQPLVGRRRVTQAMIERALLLAGDLAGARLRSAIAPGTTTGGARLVVEGQFVRIEGQIGIDNNLPATLGQWQFTGNVALNGPLGLGDQLYGSVGSQADIGRYGFPKSALGMIGVGYVLPIDNNGTTLTTEFLNSRTQPAPAPHVPLSVGSYTRGLVRLSVAAIRSHNQTLNVTSGYEMITQSEKLPQLSVQQSRDHYLVWRLGLNWQRNLGNSAVSVDAVLSRGLAGRDGNVSLPTSRAGAVADFTNFEGTAHASVPGPSGFSLDITARGKTSFGQPQFLSEQFALDAGNGVSSFPGGSFIVDTGATLRGELHYPPLTLGNALTIAPYLFGAGGLGWIARPTKVEQNGTGYYRAASAGLGGRIGLSGLPLMHGTAATISFELGHQFSNVAGRSGGQRASLAVGVRF